jgi:hypothetical protein
MLNYNFVRIMRKCTGVSKYVFNWCQHDNIINQLKLYGQILNKQIYLLTFAFNIISLKT